ncbi:hypothetical protein K7X08_022361 [Anisodus acutangulus]|uniref:Carbohydrate kinase FGGY C-terminal domain-containing protein n=1 Tax=Anisodus acutangulus TaxID=402998 RepID=A0A9Q1MHU4_9SOLA|nr:hypothetical protein K7X08_022361 [Anisodus acutangulus]
MTLLPTTLRSVFIGVDVATGSTRAGLFNEDGKLLGSASSPIQIWKDGDCVEINEKDSRDMEASGWDDGFWEEIGLGDLVDGHHAKIGRSVAFPGHALGSGLTLNDAMELGLMAGTPVGTALIDAHASVVGIMESVPASDSESIAMVPEYWLTGGGQSSTGSLLDHIIENHVASPHLANRAASRRISIFDLLNETLELMKQDEGSPFIAALTNDIHILPDFHGNRSLIADPKSKGMISGLTLGTSEKQLALLYLATVQGIAYGTHHIVEHCNANGHKKFKTGIFFIRPLMILGGHAC